MMRRRSSVLAGAVAFGVLALGLGPVPGADASSAAPAGRYIVRVGPGVGAPVAGWVDAHGGTVLLDQEQLGLLVVTLPEGAAGDLATLSGVQGLSPDRTIASQSLGFDPSTQAGSMTNVNRIIGATNAWKSGYTGNGVDVAIIDTGIAPVPALTDATKVVVGPDLSFEDQNIDLKALDSYGHGTHMASIIAGREVAKGSGTNYATDTTNFYGVAPDARLINLKLADQHGVVDVSQIIAAIGWVVQNKTTNGMNIRVLNLSYGTQSPQSPQADPLSWAAECAWKAGIVVVAAAGNNGGTYPGLANPAYNPWVLAIGASDTKGTDTTADDVVASFSAVQGGNWGTRAPDLVAPGVGIIAAGVPGSVIYDGYPAAHIGNNFLRGSGTSMSAAVVSGAIADMLQARSWLTPDQVKAVLMATATSLTGQPATAQGKGELNLTSALTANVPYPLQSPTNGTGNGSLQSARGDMVSIQIGSATLQGELDVMGNQWNANTFAANAAAHTGWNSSYQFNTQNWNIGTGFATDTTSWAGRTWSGRTWSGRTWSGATWQNGSWSGRTWSGRTWSGTGWTGASWSDPIAPSAFTSSTWAGTTWK